MKDIRAVEPYLGLEASDGTISGVIRHQPDYQDRPTNSIFQKYSFILQEPHQNVKRSADSDFLFLSQQTSSFWSLSHLKRLWKFKLLTRIWRILWKLLNPHQRPKLCRGCSLSAQLLPDTAQRRGETRDEKSPRLARPAVWEAIYQFSSQYWSSVEIIENCYNHAILHNSIPELTNTSICLMSLLYIVALSPKHLIFCYSQMETLETVHSFRWEYTKIF